MIQRSLGGDYSHVVACFHPVTVARNPEAQRGLDSILGFCEANEIPVRTLKDIADFAEARRNVGIELCTQGDRTILTVSGPGEVPQSGVTLLTPGMGVGGVTHAGAELPTITLGGQSYYWHVLTDLPATFVISGTPT
jgi:hypothetical protein